MNVLDRFFNKIEVDANGCWLWIAYLDRDGYGRFRDAKSKKVYAHRFSYEYFCGLIQEGMVIDHICRVRNCVNPKHLRCVSVRDNVLKNSRSKQALNKVKTVCKNGHSFNSENTGTDKRGDRYCKQCARDRSKVRYAARRI